MRNATGITVCHNCTQVHEKSHAMCPYCGYTRTQYSRSITRRTLEIIAVISALVFIGGIESIVNHLFGAAG